MYRSDFTDDDEVINQNKLYSSTKLNASMPLFSGNVVVFVFINSFIDNLPYALPIDSDNDESMMTVSKKPFMSLKCESAGSNQTRKLKHGWSPSPNKLKCNYFILLKFQYLLIIFNLF